MSSEQSSFDNRIAVIGLSCRFPGSNSPDEFWHNIITQKETIQRFTQHELMQAGVSSSLIHDEHYVCARGIISEAEYFDAAFFGYTPAEACVMDPQHRVFLEESWIALEQAGYNPETFPGLIGVFAGMNDSSYLLNHLLKNRQILVNQDMQQLLLATSTHYLSTKVAYQLGLTGPALTINTACSTGLVTIAMACEQLLSHTCDIALAGAITLTAPQQSGYLYKELGILSLDG